MAENISASLGWQLADAVRAMTKRTTGPTTGTAQYVGRDAAGNALVLLPGADQPTPVQGPVSASAEVGSTVTYSLANGRLSITGNASDPAVGEAKATQIADVVVKPVAAAVKVTRAAADAAKSIADAAQRVASAIDQHFWTSDDGIHVTQVTQEEWSDSEGTSYQSGPNVLINSLGQLFRNGVNNLLSMLPAQTATDTFTGDGTTKTFTLTETPISIVSVTVGGTEISAYTAAGTTVTLTTAPATGSEVVVTYRTSETVIAIWDGLGNTASNVAASFGKVVQLGRSNESHSMLDYHSLQLIDKEGSTYFYVSDLRDESGEAELTETFTGDGNTRIFYVSFPRSTDISATDSSDPDNEYSISGQTSYTFENAPADGAIVTIVYKTQSNNVKAYTLGRRTTNSTIGAYSYALGDYISASGRYAHAEGYRTTASGSYSHVEGSFSTASGRYAHAEGSNTIASNDFSHAEGTRTEASGKASHAEGYYTTASGNWSHSQGYLTEAASLYQTVIGIHNVKDANNKYAFIIGNGTNNTASNAYAVAWDGTVTHGVDVPKTSLPLSSAAQAYSDAQAPHYSRWGNVVQVYGAVKPKSDVAAGGTLTIGTLPSGCRPSQLVSVLCQGSGNSVWLLQIADTGVLTASRYRNGASVNAAMGTSVWLTFTTTFIV